MTDAPSSLPARPMGLIVAGGRGLRLGGGDKTLRLLAGRALLSLIVERLLPQCAALALNANGDPARFAAFGLPIVPDRPEDVGMGPLAGVVAGLAWAAGGASASPDLLTLPGDVPLPPADLVDRLRAAQRPGRVTAARSAGRRHPLVALWPLEARHALARALSEGGVRRVDGALERIGVDWVDWPAGPFDPFHNVNTRDDLAAAERWLAAEQRSS